MKLYPMTPSRLISFLGNSEIGSNVTKAAAIGTGAVIEAIGSSSIATVAAATVAAEVVAPIAVCAAVGYGIYKFFSE